MKTAQELPPLEANMIRMLEEQVHVTSRAQRVAEDNLERYEKIIDVHPKCQLCGARGTCNH